MPLRKHYLISHMSVRIFSADTSSRVPLPYANDGIQAGFPSPAQEFINESIDLNKELIEHPAATFYGRVVGDSMVQEGIEEGDILIIDRSLEPMNKDLAVCCVDGDFTLKRIRIESDKAWLMPSNEVYDPILVTSDNHFQIWGVVTYIIKSYRRPRFCR